MRFTFYRGVPALIVKRLLWGAGFATPFGIVVKETARPQTYEHEYKHFKDWWQFIIIGFIVIYAVHLIYGRFKLGNWYDAYKNVIFERRARKYAGQPV